MEKKPHGDICFEEWIYNNHPMFDIDSDHLQSFMDWHFKVSDSYEKNFEELQEWLNED